MKYAPILLLLMVLSCRNLNTAPAEHSIYYWKTAFGPDSSMAAFIQKEKINHVYIHYFDVVMDPASDMPVPVAEMLDPENGKAFIVQDFTPVVFIANECFKKTFLNWDETLPKKINDKIIYITNQLKKSAGNQTAIAAKEIQIDCDWTPETKGRYFKFLAAFKALNPGITISATIRLYPYKYRDKMGIPPVDKGLLMCYNLSPITEVGNSNSIFSLKELKQYLSTPAYPLPLDMALPIFGWYAWFRNEKFKGIIYPDADESIPAGGSPTLQKIGGNVYRVKQDTLAGNEYLRPNDLLRVEYPDEQELWEAYKLLNKKIPSIKRIAFYHFDKSLVNRYEAIIHKIYDQQ